MTQNIQPEYVDNYLAHFGVVGMKWGKRGRGGSDESSSGVTAKPKKEKITTADIKTARESRNVSLNKMNEAHARSLFAETAKGRAKAEKLVDKYEKEAFDSDNARVANKLTKGEKVLNTAAWTTYGAVVVSSLAVVAKSR